MVNKIEIKNKYLAASSKSRLLLSHARTNINSIVSESTLLLLSDDLVIASDSNNIE